MATSIASGLGATLGYAAEGTVGTYTTVARWPRFNSEGFALVKTHTESAGLHQGLTHEAQRRAYVQRQATGTVSMDLAYKEMGLLFKHMLGSSATTTQQGGTTAYLQTHAPGDTKGLGLSVQIGRPFTNGTIQQFNYNGCKIIDWTITVPTGGIADLSLTIDGWNETTATAYASPSFITNPYVADFSQGVVKVGGTASTSVGVTSISAGAAPTGVISNVVIKGTNAMKTDRFNIGSQTKQEQLVNNFRTYDVEFDIDFANVADVYTAFAADTSTPFQLTLTSGQLAGTAFPFKIDIVIPSLAFNEDPIPVGGPDVLQQKVKGVALDDGTNNVFQIQYTSTDTSI